jgi:hypothetical protein
LVSKANRQDYNRDSDASAVGYYGAHRPRCLAAGRYLPALSLTGLHTCVILQDGSDDVPVLQIAGHSQHKHIPDVSKPPVITWVHQGYIISRLRIKPASM